MSWGPSLHEGFQSCFQNERRVTFCTFASNRYSKIEKFENATPNTGGRKRVFRFFHSHLALLVGCPFEARERRYLNHNLYYEENKYCF